MAREIRLALMVWLVLAGATIVSYVFQLEAYDNAHVAGSAVLLIAFFKVRLIGLRYMELRDAGLPLRLAFELWVAVFAAILLVLFWLGE